MFYIKKKDKVVILTGKDKGKRGEVLKIISDESKVVISKINIAKKHMRPTQTDPGGIKDLEAPLNISNVKLICPKCDQSTRPKYDFLSDNKKVRVCRKCGEIIL